MLSDEEKQVIEYLKRHIIPCYGRKGTIEFMLNDTLLNLIEKQSKEIEELTLDLEEMTKSNNHKKENWVHKSILNSYVSKDKIKAKIEEIDKVLNEDIYVIDGHYDDRYYRYLQDKHILQSLLEKE